MIQSGQFSAMLAAFTSAVERADTDAFVALFAPDGVYDDGIYGRFEGRDRIRSLLDDGFFRDGEGYRWEMFDPVVAGTTGYAHWLFSFTSRRPGLAGQRALMTGCSQFLLNDDGSIKLYRDWANGASTLLGIGIPVEHLAPLLRRLDAALRADPASVGHLQPPA
jgi:ketosteroid isomerase-like protein